MKDDAPPAVGPISDEELELVRRKHSEGFFGPGSVLGVSGVVGRILARLQSAEAQNAALKRRAEIVEAERDSDNRLWSELTEKLSAAEARAYQLAWDAAEQENDARYWRDSYDRCATKIGQNVARKEAAEAEAKRLREALEGWIEKYAAGAEMTTELYAITPNPTAKVALRTVRSMFDDVQATLSPAPPSGLSVRDEGYNEGVEAAIKALDERFAERDIVHPVTDRIAIAGHEHRVQVIRALTREAPAPTEVSGG